MKESKSRGWLPVVGGLFLAATTTLVVAQNGDRSPKEPSAVQDQIPPEVLRTKEGRQIVERLGMLRRHQSTMGPKHPAFRGLQSEIESIRTQLGLSPTGAGETDRINLDGMEQDELRQLIRRMALRIESLEKRVEALERRFEVF